VSLFLKERYLVFIPCRARRNLCVSLCLAGLKPRGYMKGFQEAARLRQKK